MKVFLSHARKDNHLAVKLAARLARPGFAVLNSQEAIASEDNWAKMVGQALEDSELMVFLLTPKALESDRVRQEIEYALGNKKFAGRVFSVFVAPTLGAGKDVPWILLKLPHRQVESADDFPDVVREIKTLRSDSDLSHTNA